MAEEHVDQLRKFIEAPPAQESAGGGDPVVRFPGGDLWRRRLVHGHCPEFQDAKPPPVAAHPFLGEERVIVSGPGRSVQLKPGRVEVPGSEEQVPARLVGFFKQSARGRLAEACDCYSGQLGRDYARLTLRDTRSRWGSCSSRGALMFSWRLVMAPRNVMDYVAAHEVAHLVEMNHSPAFWDVVDDLYGDPTAPRRWLRQNGETLHRYRFGD